MISQQSFSLMCSCASARVMARGAGGASIVEELAGELPVNAVLSVCYGMQLGRWQVMACCKAEVHGLVADAEPFRILSLPASSANLKASYCSAQTLRWPTCNRAWNLSSPRRPR